MPAAFLAFLFLAQALLIVIHLAVAETLAAAFGIGGVWLPLLFFALSFSFLAASLLARRRSGWFARSLYLVAVYWLGLVFFFFGGAFIFFVTATLLYGAGWYVSPALLGTACFGIFFLIHLYGTRHSGRTRLAKIDITIPGLPPAWHGKTIVFVSDLHLGNVRGRRFAEKIGRMIQALRPEAILIGGDLYDGTACNEREIIAPLRAAVAAASRGAYFVTGNHDYLLAAPERAFTAIRDAGIRILNNEAANIDGVRVVGVDYESARHRDDFKKILAAIVPRGGAGADAPTILLKHEPSGLEVARDAGVALGLFGHTHGGQIWPLTYLVRRIYRGFEYGLRSSGSLTAYTTSGAGTWGPPLRLGTRSEVVEIALDRPPIIR